MKLIYKIVVLLVGALLLIAVVVSFWTYRQIGRFADARMHTLIALNNASELISHLLDAETSQRGYLLTGDEAFLEPYLRGCNNISPHLEALRSITSISAAQQHLDTMIPLIDAKLAHMSRNIELRRNQGIAAAQAAVGSAQGRRLMDSIRVEMDSFIQIHQVALAKYDAEFKLNMRHLFILIVIASLLVMLLALSFVYLNYLETQYRLLKVTKKSEDEAREYAESIINTVREPLIALDQDLRVASASRSFYEVFKVNPKETVGHLIYDLGNKQWDIPKLRKLLETILPEKATFENYEVEHNFASVGRRIMLLNARQIQRVLGKERIILLAIEDITDRKKENELLQASEIQYRRLFEAAQDGILMLDAETGDVLDVNPFLINILGYSKKHIQSKRIWEMGFLHDTIGNKDKFLELQQKKYVRYENLPLETADGRRLDVEFVSNVYMAGRRKVIQCNIRDITKRREIENGLEKTRQELVIIKKIADEASEFSENVINTVREPLIALDQGLRVVKVSRSFYGFFKVKPEDTIGQLIYDLGNKQWDIPKLRELLETILPQKATFDNYEVEHDFAGIGRHIMLLNARQIERAFGKEKIILLAIQDITERKRMESISRLATVVRDSNDAITIQNPQGNITAWNRGAELMFGYSEQEALAMTVWQLVPPNKVAEQKDFNYRIFAGEKVTSFETQRLAKDGRLIDVWMTVTKLVDDAGKVTGIASTERNITERKKREIKLIESEDRYKRITAGLTDYLYSVSVEDGKAVKTVHNEACLSVTGYTAEEIVSDPHLWINMVVPEDKALVADRINKILKGKDLTSFEHRIVCKGGEIRWISDTAIPKYDSKGVLVSYDGVIKDITDRKRAEKALVASEIRFRKLFDNMSNAVAVYEAVDGGEDFVFKDFNSFAEKVERVRREEVLGKRVTEVFPGVREFGFLEIFKKVWITGKPEYLPATLYKDERSLAPSWRENHIFKLPSDEIVAIYEDITERKHLEEQLLQSQKMDAIGTLAGGIAHDFNNLLTVISGNSNIAMSEIDKTSQTYKDIKEINIAATRAALLTRQLLLYSRKQPMRLHALNINKIINDLVKMLKRLLGEDVEIKLELEPDILSVKADLSNLEQVITNLCINARDAMPKGGTITIKTENMVISEDESKAIDNSCPGRYVLLSITDTGSGMDKETIKRIFEPFFTTKGLGKGTGLGLSVVYGIIKAHNGWINVYSEPTHGAIFKAYLPAIKSEAAVISEVKEELDRLKGKGEHILIIEDDESVLEYIERILLKNNYCIHKAVSSQNAVKVFKENSKRIDLVITDMILTDENGLDIIDKLKLIKNNIGVIICSGYLDDKANFLEIQKKGYEFIQKPFEAIGMLRTIRQILDGKK